jgi:hypothetical protein
MNHVFVMRSLISMALGGQQKRTHGQTNIAGSKVACGKHTFGYLLSEIFYDFIMRLTFNVITTILSHRVRVPAPFFGTCGPRETS